MGEAGLDGGDDLVAFLGMLQCPSQNGELEFYDPLGSAAGAFRDIHFQVGVCRVVVALDVPVAGVKQIAKPVGRRSRQQVAVGERVQVGVCPVHVFHETLKDRAAVDEIGGMIDQRVPEVHEALPLSGLQHGPEIASAPSGLCACGGEAQGQNYEQENPPAAGAEAADDQTRAEAATWRATGEHGCRVRRANPGALPGFVRITGDG